MGSTAWRAVIPEMGTTAAAGAESVGSARKFSLLSLCVFGGSTRHAEHRVPHGTPTYCWPGGDDCAGHVASGYERAWPPQPGRQANEVGPARKKVPRASVDASGLDA